MSNLIEQTVEFKIKEETGEGVIIEKYTGMTEYLTDLPSGEHGYMKTTMFYVSQDFYIIDCKGILMHVPCSCVTKMNRC